MPRMNGRRLPPSSTQRRPVSVSLRAGGDGFTPCAAARGAEPALSPEGSDVRATGRFSGAGSGEAPCGFADSPRTLMGGRLPQHRARRRPTRTRQTPRFSVRLSPDLHNFLKSWVDFFSPGALRSFRPLVMRGTPRTMSAARDLFELRTSCRSSKSHGASSSIGRRPTSSGPVPELLGATAGTRSSDLVALKAAKRLIDAGVSVQRIRKSIRALRKILPTVRRPLAELILVATGDVVLAFQGRNRVRCHFGPAVGLRGRAVQARSRGLEALDNGGARARSPASSGRPRERGNNARTA